MLCCHYNRNRHAWQGESGNVIRYGTPYDSQRDTVCDTSGKKARPRQLQALVQIPAQLTPKQEKSPAFLQDSQNENGADTRIRTGDLILTNALMQTAAVHIYDACAWKSFF